MLPKRVLSKSSRATLQYYRHSFDAPAPTPQPRNENNEYYVKISTTELKRSAIHIQLQCTMVQGRNPRSAYQLEANLRHSQEESKSALSGSHQPVNTVRDHSYVVMNPSETLRTPSQMLPEHALSMSSRATLRPCRRSFDALAPTPQSRN